MVYIFIEIGTKKPLLEKIIWGDYRICKEELSSTYVQGNPLSFSDPSGTDVSKGGDIYDKMDNDHSISYKIIASYDTYDHYDPNLHTVFWKPVLGVCTDGAYQSPAIQFAQEFTHAYDSYINPARYKIESSLNPIGSVFLLIFDYDTWRNYDTPEERRVITGLENRIAIYFGEPTRTNHHGVTVSAPTFY